MSLNGRKYSALTNLCLLTRGYSLARRRGCPREFGYRKTKRRAEAYACCDRCFVDSNFKYLRGVRSLCEPRRTHPGHEYRAYFWYLRRIFSRFRDGLAVCSRSENMACCALLPVALGTVCWLSKGVLSQVSCSSSWHCRFGDTEGCGRTFELKSRIGVSALAQKHRSLVGVR
jgi:hypothetical protein